MLSLRKKVWISILSCAALALVFHGNVHATEYKFGWNLSITEDDGNKICTSLNVVSTGPPKIMAVGLLSDGRSVVSIVADAFTSAGQRLGKIIFRFDNNKTLSSEITNYQWEDDNMIIMLGSNELLSNLMRRNVWSFHLTSRHDL
mgnify:CR=1 FL=1